MAPTRRPTDENTAEYEQFVATEPITVDGALAFMPGDPVPAGHVKNGIVADTQVARAGTKAAANATDTGDTTTS